MKRISDVIKELNELKSEYGDIEVIGTDDQEISCTIYDDEGEDTVLVME